MPETSLQGDVIGRLGFGDVSNRAGFSEMIDHPQNRPRELLCPFYHVKRQQNDTICKPENGPHHTDSSLAWILDFSASRTVRNRSLYGCNRLHPTVLGYSNVSRKRQQGCGFTLRPAQQEAFTSLPSVSPAQPSCLPVFLLSFGGFQKSSMAVDVISPYSCRPRVL